MHKEYEGHHKMYSTAEHRKEESRPYFFLKRTGRINNTLTPFRFNATIFSTINAFILFPDPLYSSFVCAATRYDWIPKKLRLFLSLFIYLFLKKILSQRLLHFHVVTVMITEKRRYSNAGIFGSHIAKQKNEKNVSTDNNMQ